VTTPTMITFSDDRGAAAAAIDAVSAGRGWCNVSPNVEQEAPDMKVNYFGLRLNKGVTVASFVTAPPPVTAWPNPPHSVSCILEVASAENASPPCWVAPPLRFVKTTTPEDYSSRFPSTHPPKRS
jgi:hypothetical protein